MHEKDEIFWNKNGEVEKIIDDKTETFVLNNMAIGLGDNHKYQIKTDVTQTGSNDNFVYYGMDFDDDGRIDKFVDLDDYMTQDEIDDLFQTEKDNDLKGTTTNTPGFELIIMACAIALIWIIKKKKERF